MYRLVIEDDEGRSTVVPLLREELSIGRKEGNTIRLTERNVSRRHARVYRENNLFYIEDLGSYNGLRINGERVTGRRPLREGDQIQIGDYLLRLLRDTGRTSLDEEHPDPVVARTRSAAWAHAKTEPMGHATEEPPPRPERRAAPDTEAPLDAPRLVVLTPALGVTEISLREGDLTLGREGDVALPHRSLARQHARVHLDGRTATVHDLGAGVRVNGEPVASATLREGDLVELGQVKLRFAAARTLAERPAPARPDAQPSFLAPADTAAAEETFFSPTAVVVEPVARAEEAVGEMPGRRRRRQLPYLALAAGVVAIVSVAIYLTLERMTGRPPPPSSPVAAPRPATAPSPPPVAERAPVLTPAPPPPIAERAPVPTPAAPPPVVERAPLPAGPPDERPAVRAAAPPDELPAARAAAPPDERPAARAAASPDVRRPAPPAPRGDRGEPEEVVAPEPEAPAALRTRSPVERKPHPVPETRRDKPRPDPAAARRTAREKARELLQQGTKELLRSPVRAIEVFRKAIELDPRLAAAHKNLGIAYSAIENTAAAIRHLQRYLTLRPDAPDAAEVRQQIADLTKGGGP